jgi:hypothetical protein
MCSRGMIKGGIAIPADSSEFLEAQPCPRNSLKSHNPKVGGSNPPPATKLFIGLRASDVSLAGAERGS